MMEDKYRQQEVQVQGYPLAPATIVPRSDEVSAPPLPMEEPYSNKRRRMQCLAIVIAFVIIQSIVLFLLLFITRVTTPAVELDEVTVTRGGDSLRFAARVRVRNTNFGHFEFDSTTVTVRSSGNEDAAKFQIPKSRVKSRSMKKISMVVDLGSHPGGSDAEPSESDRESGVVNLQVKGELEGKVEVMRVIRKKKTAVLDCKMRVSLSTTEVRDLRCT